MLLLTFLLSLSVPVPAQATEVKGVHPSSYPKYVPTSSNLWSCLDGSRSIPWSAVNDDYCDCRDGSDEPGMTPCNRPIRTYSTLTLHLGTSACPNSSFFCPNIGHVGASISATRVNDGLCGQFILFSFLGSPSSMNRARMLRRIRRTFRRMSQYLRSGRYPSQSTLGTRRQTT